MIVFAGPSLSRVPAEALAGFAMRGPARQGDVYRAALEGPRAIGLVDGYFEAVPSVWHKEILWALSQGIGVYGAASIGALRAVELAPFGMVGVGLVFAAFRDGVLGDDDEVALQHGPAEAGYLPVSEAMVNVRATLERAAREGVVERDIAAAIGGAAKGIFYKERTYAAVLKAAGSEGVPQEALAALAAWLPAGRMDQKKRDALEMLALMRADHEAGVVRRGSAFVFHRTAMWEDARRRR